VPYRKDEMKIFSDPRVTLYNTPDHPESSWRVSQSVEHLESQGFHIRPPSLQATEKDILSVHTRQHWQALRSGSYSDLDTPHFDGIDEVARISLSGCLSAFETGLAGETAFSLMRPPGHHAGKNRVSGFCYLNNMAIACRRGLSKNLKMAVLDIDVHHGDGTEEIALGQKGWLYVSLHQVPLYPGTGHSSKKNCLNYPLEPFTKPPEYLNTLAKAIQNITDFNPDLLGVSAGFDTYKECPLAQVKLDKETYKEMGEMMARTKLKRFAILEGGYAPDLPVLIENFLRGFSGE